MDTYKDVESAGEFKQHSATDAEYEQEALLPRTNNSLEQEPIRTRSSPYSFSSHPKIYAFAAFLAGVVSCAAVQFFVCHPQNGANTSTVPHRNVEVFAPPHAGSSEVHHFPPASPTNVFPSLFPTDVGYAGPTPTGAEPALIITAPSYPVHTGAPHLVSPKVAHKGNKDKHSKFDIFKYWGNLSPWFSVERSAFGLDSSPEVPDTCRLTGLHLVHRHGARYPTQFASYGGPANFSGRLNQAAAGWTATGDLKFMNEWCVLPVYVRFHTRLHIAQDIQAR